MLVTNGGTGVGCTMPSVDTLTTRLVGIRVFALGIQEVEHEVCLRVRAVVMHVVLRRGVMVAVAHMIFVTSQMLLRWGTKRQKRLSLFME